MTGPISPATARAALERLFQAALDAARPGLVVPGHLPAPPRGRTIVIGCGKAAAAMAAAVEAAWPADKPIGGLVVTRYGHAVATRHIEVVEAAHPVPDSAGRAAAERILELARGAGPDDLVLCLISGGGSALLALPADDIEMADKREVTGRLLRSGAAIDEINCVRKHLSAIKGGRLAVAAAPAPIVTLAISDVPGDDPAIIASGPTVADPTSFADAAAILAKYDIAPPESVARRFSKAIDETPKPGDPRLANARTVIIARPVDSLARAAEAARAMGITPFILGDALEGEARDVGRVHAGIARFLAGGGVEGFPIGRPPRAPAVILSGGETTVTVRGKGRGGRNAEFLLAFGLASEGLAGVHALACDTDGIDGSEDNAGAYWAPDTAARARAMGLDPAAILANNDAYRLFAAVDALIVTGPTRTNVNDFRAILVLD